MFFDSDLRHFAAVSEMTVKGAKRTFISKSWQTMNVCRPLVTKIVAIGHVNSRRENAAQGHFGGERDKPRGNEFINASGWLTNSAARR